MRDKERNIMILQHGNVFEICMPSANWCNKCNRKVTGRDNMCKAIETAAHSLIGSLGRRLP